MPTTLIKGPLKAPWCDLRTGPDCPCCYLWEAEQFMAICGKRISAFRPDGATMGTVQFLQTKVGQRSTEMKCSFLSTIFWSSAVWERGARLMHLFWWMHILSMVGVLWGSDEKLGEKTKKNPEVFLTLGNRDFQETCSYMIVFQIVLKEEMKNRSWNGNIFWNHKRPRRKLRQ